MKDNLKFLFLTTFVIALPIISHMLGNADALNIESTIYCSIIIYGAFLVTKKKSRLGLILWILGFAGPKIFYGISALSNINSYENPLYVGFITIAHFGLCLCLSRLSMQWTSPIWLRPEIYSKAQKMNLHRFWKAYIYIEMLILISFFGGLIDLTLDKTSGGNIITAFIIGGGYKLYNEAKKSSLKILSPIAQELEKEELKNQKLENIKTSESILGHINGFNSCFNEDTLDSAFHKSIIEHPQHESMLSRAYKERKKHIKNA